MECKWEVITMEFITRLPKTMKQLDIIMVIVDNLSKVALFVNINSTHKVENIVNIFMREVSRFHGMPTVMELNRKLKFTLNIWKGIF
jgi:hypothetical protein